MYNMTWSRTEKLIARRAFDAALQRELASVMADFKRRAQQANAPSDLWDIEEFLTRARREIDSKYDYRYSQLILVFARLAREGHLHVAELDGLSEEKLAAIRRILSF